MATITDTKFQIDGLFRDQGTGAFYKREDSARDRGLEACMTCGRGVKEGSGFKIVVVDGGDHVLAVANWEDEHDSGFMGAWVIGPECGRKIPAPFKTKFEGWN